MRHIPNYLSATALFALTLAAGEIVAQDAAPPKAAAAAATQAAVFAKVGDAVITREEYNAAFNAAARAKFYHGKPPENEIALLQREVSDQMVARIVLLREAKRTELRPDDAEVQKTVQSYEQRYAGSEQWKKNRAQMLPPLLVRLEQDSLLKQMEKTVRGSVKPNESEVKAYYAAHQEQFTEPEQMRASVILLKVDPSSPSAAWVKADEQAQAIAKRARDGEDFAALARRHSGDASAQQGGDLGYLHGGMLPEGTQEVLLKLKAGEMSDSVRLLEGFAVFRMSDRKPARLQPFDAVKARAEGLAQRQQSDRAWAAFIADLKAKTPTQIDQSGFLPLAGQAPARATAK